MLALSGQNIDEFMKEMESVHKSKDPDVDFHPMSQNPHPNPTQPQNHPQNPIHTHQMSRTDSLLAPPGTDPTPIRPQNHPHQPQPQPIPQLLFPPMRLPPGPPPGRPNLPPGPPPGLPPRLASLRLPPAPPRLLRIPAPPQIQNNPIASLGGNSSLLNNLSASLIPSSAGIGSISGLGTPNVVSAGPQLIRSAEAGKQGATIMAKPQIRNLSVDVTRFVPSALRVKREDKRVKSNARTMLVNELKQKEMMAHAMLMTGQPTKDDAYMQFMREMEGLL